MYFFFVNAESTFKYRGLACGSGLEILPLLKLGLVLLLVPLAHQDVPEGGPEGLVAEGVAHGVDRAVDVAQPVPEGPQGPRDAVLAKGVHQHHDVVRQPRGDEREQDGAERPRRLPVVGFLLVLALADLPLGFGGEAFGHGGVFHGDAPGPVGGGAFR